VRRGDTLVYVGTTAAARTPTRAARWRWSSSRRSADRPRGGL